MEENGILSMFASKESALLFVSLKNFLLRQSPLYFNGEHTFQMTNGLSL